MALKVEDEDTMAKHRSDFYTKYSLAEMDEREYDTLLAAATDKSNTESWIEAGMEMEDFVLD